MSETGNQVTERQRYLMRHALGLDQAKKSYRNRYSCAAHGKTAAEWEEMVSLGLAERTPEMGGSLWWYRVSKVGCDALGVVSDE